jgi:hypothetical protein
MAEELEEILERAEPSYYSNSGTAVGNRPEETKTRTSRTEAVLGRQLQCHSAEK